MAHWELVCIEHETTGIRTDRLPVNGGWLYRCKSGTTVSLCFVEDAIRERNDPKQPDYRVFAHGRGKAPL